MKTINRKINNLEDKVLQPFQMGTTRWTVEDDAEQRLFDQAVAIGKTMEFEDLTPAQSQIIDEAQKRIWLHGIDLFNNMVGAQVHYDRPEGKVLWNMWLGYFIQEASKGISQILRENAIMEQEGKTWKQKEKEADALPKFVKVFTRERFEQYISDVMERSLKPKFRKQLEKVKP